MSIIINVTISTWGYDLVSRKDKVFTFFPSSHSICEWTGHKVAKICDFMLISYFNYIFKTKLFDESAKNTKWNFRNFDPERAQNGVFL